MRNFHQKSCSLPSTQVPASTRVVTQCEKGRVTSSNDRNKGEWLTNHCMIVFCVRLAKSFKREFILRAKISNDFRKQDASEITHQTEQNKFKLHHAPWNRVSISNLREIHLFSFKQQNLSNEWLLPEK